MPSPSSMPLSVWPSSLALDSRRRQWGTSASIWAPHNLTSTSFDPFASDSSWDTSRPLFSPSKNESVNSADPESPEHISMMLRDLGITPSPRPTPTTPGDSPTSPSTPPMLSPTTQILSLGSNSTIRFTHQPFDAAYAESDDANSVAWVEFDDPYAHSDAHHRTLALYAKARGAPTSLFVGD
ncbi:hypothetical protein RSAG8_08869, partial [Rhizoctonia solani AG-8 WAC10335]